jgi:hypothetical protein
MNNFSTIELTPVKKGEHYNPDQVFIVASAMTGFSDSQEAVMCTQQVALMK